MKKNDPRLQSVIVSDEDWEKLEYEFQSRDLDAVEIDEVIVVRKPKCRHP